MNTALINRLAKDKYGRRSDKEQAVLKGEYRREGLFSTQDEWLDTLDTYFDDCVSHAYDVERFA